MRTEILKANVRWTTGSHARGQEVKGVLVMRYNTAYVLEISTQELVAIDALSTKATGENATGELLSKLVEVRRLPHTVQW